MKKFCLVSLAAAGLFVGGCTATDRFFGNDMIPPSQQLTTRVDTVMPMTTYQITFDSIPSRVVGSTPSQLAPLGYVGSVIDPLVGRTTMGTIANFVPEPYTKSNEFQEHRFGIDPTVDSMILHLYWASPFAVGDTTQKIKVSIYPINKRLHSDTVYHSCFDPTGIYDPAKPLAEFMTNGTDSLQIKFPKWYYDQFITPELNEPGVDRPYSSDSVFLDAFKGFYFKTEHVNPGNRGLIAAINLGVSRIYIHYQNKGLKEGVKPDTTKFRLAYSFYFVNPSDNRIYYTPHNTSFLIADHDYSLATDPRRVDMAVINDLTVPCSTVFVQGLGGLAVLAQMDKGAIDGLKAKAVEMGFKHVGVHRAELRWKVPERSLFYYDDSFSKLVMANWTGSRSTFTPLRDYNPWNLNHGDNAMEGSLWRSVGYYSQNITSYIQQVLGGGNDNLDLLLMPDFGFMLETLNPLRSVVGGSEGIKSLQPELIITYTLIR